MEGVTWGAGVGVQCTNKMGWINLMGQMDQLVQVRVSKLGGLDKLDRLDGQSNYNLLLRGICYCFINLFFDFTNYITINQMM